MKLPFIGSYVPEADLLNAEAKARGYEARLKNLEDDLVVAKRAISEVLPKLMKLTVYDTDYQFNTNRICVDIDQRAIERAFLQGNSDREIRFFAGLLADAVERKMIEFNFLRREGL